MVKEKERLIQKLTVYSDAFQMAGKQLRIIAPPVKAGTWRGIFACQHN